MEYRTLENIDSICIYEAFTQAFSDYQVSVDMSFKSFEYNVEKKWIYACGFSWSLL